MKNKTKAEPASERLNRATWLEGDDLYPVAFFAIADAGAALLSVKFMRERGVVLEAVVADRLVRSLEKTVIELAQGIGAGSKILDVTFDL